MKLPLTDGIKLIEKASHEKEKEKLFSIWLVRYQNMTKDNFISFDQFCEQCKPQKVTINKRSAVEILEEARSIRKALGKEW